MIITTYHSPLGDISLAADARGLTRLRFVDDGGQVSPCDPDDRHFDMHRGAFEDEGPSAPDEEVAGRDAVSGAHPMSASHPGNAAAVSVLERAWAWLNAYFSGNAPQWVPPMHLGGTELEHDVWVALLGVGFGHVTTCADLLERVLARGAWSAGSAGEEGVAAAVRACPVAIIVPTHRVADLDVAGAAPARIPGLLRSLEAPR